MSSPAMDSETLARVELQRRELEDNIARLRKSLRHWQTLEIDYEGLQEEFQRLPVDASYDECLRAAEEFKPESIDGKELDSLFLNKSSDYRHPSQLVDILSKRVDYVTRNVSTIRRQLSNAERKRNVLLLAQDPETQDEAGLPLSDIVEELDEDGNIISSTVQAPGTSTPALIDVLRQAGVTDINMRKTVSEDGAQPTEGIVDVSHTALHSGSSSLIPEPTSASSEAQHAEALSDGDDASFAGDKLGPVNPDDDEEDAALRQEMLQYGLDEVGAIVATLDLEDAGDLSFDDDEGDDYLSDYDEDEDLYTDETEDEQGATKNPVISDRYRRKMEALSKKHGITDMQNLGPNVSLPENLPENPSRPTAAEAARKAAIQRAEASKSALRLADTEEKSTEEPKKKKKRVAFAQSLDIAKESPITPSDTGVEHATNPVGDVIIERMPGGLVEEQKAPSASTQPSAPKKVSRFKATRTATPSTPMFPPPMEFPSSSTTQPTPEGPPGRTISETLVERPTTQTSVSTDPSDFNEDIHRREVAVEYQKMRNRKIHEQGGYVRGGELEDYGDEMTPEVILDENTGKPKKISRFKAARIKSQTS